MKICFPVLVNEGLASDVFGHFGSAPMFVVVNTDTSEVTSINNSDQIHEHGSCNPIAGFELIQLKLVPATALVKFTKLVDEPLHNT